jgi:hypothetical protein
LSATFVLKSSFGLFPQICHAASFFTLLSSLVATPLIISKLLSADSIVAGEGGASGGLFPDHHGHGAGVFGGVFSFDLSSAIFASCAVQ